MATNKQQDEKFTQFLKNSGIDAQFLGEVNGEKVISVSLNGDRGQSEESFLKLLAEKLGQTENVNTPTTSSVGINDLFQGAGWNQASPSAPIGAGGDTVDDDLDVEDDGDEFDHASIQVSVTGTSAHEFVSYIKYVIRVEAERFEQESRSFKAHISTNTNEALGGE